jgi:hypothetical protein
MVTAALSLGLPHLAWPGSIQFFATRSAFDLAAPKVPTQGFDGAKLDGQPYVIQANPLNWATNDAVFSKGSILPGLKISTRHPGQAATALIVYAGGPAGATSVGNNWFGDTLVLSFPNGVTVVGETVFANTSAGPSFAGQITEQVFHGSRLLASKTVRETAGDDVFIGATSPAMTITSVRISWASDQDATTYVSGISFGTPAAQ